MAAPNLDRTFAALADPTRRAILARLVTGDANVGELAAPFAISLPAISRHLKVLERAALITRFPDRQQRRCRLNAAGLRAAATWLDFYRLFWSESLDRLATELASPPPHSHPMKEKAHGNARRSRRRD
jgi:DNA-binding transcriptional ArsR family regulator